MGFVGRIFRVFWIAIRTVALVLGLGFIALGGAAVILAPWSDDDGAIPNHSTLYLSYSGMLGDVPQSASFLDVARGEELSMFRVVRALEEAAEDPRIEDLVVDLSDAEMDHNQAEELAEAMRTFAKSGKRSIVFSTGWDLPRYRLAATFDQIWMPDTGDFAVAGVALQTPYAGELIEDLGITPEIEKRKRFKTAADMLLEDSMSLDVRASYGNLLDSLLENMLDGIISDRKLKMTAPELQDRLAAAFWDPEAALEAGLVDRLGHFTELRRLYGKSVDYADYLAHAMRSVEGLTARVALIPVVGEIRGGEAGPFSTEVASESMIELLNEAAADDSIDAIILRIDSPGGGVTASDAIAAAITDIDKPVIASMSSVAASGGYMIAMAADRIVARPSTITGSIGVVGGKIVVEDLLSDNGIRFETVQRGRHAAIYSPFTRFTPEERRMLARAIDSIYDDFIGDVADQRGLSLTEVEDVAQGQIWTGRQALAHGLVDRLGGFVAVRDEALAALKLDSTDTVGIVEYPHLSATERLFHAADDGYLQMRSRFEWLAGPEQVAHSMEDRAGIRVEMPTLNIR